MADGNDSVTRAILKDELEIFEARMEDRMDLKLTALEDRMDLKLTALEDRMVEQMRGIETSLLKEFRKWALPVIYRVTALETHNERLALIEERLIELEKSKS